MGAIVRSGSDGSRERSVPSALGIVVHLVYTVDQMDYARPILAFPFAGLPSSAYEALVDFFAKGRAAAHRIHDQRFTRLREVVLWKPEADSDPTREARGEPLASSSDTGEVRRVHPQSPAEFPEAHPLFGQKSRQRVAERLFGLIPRHRGSFPIDADAGRARSYARAKSLHSDMPIRRRGEVAI